MPDPQRISREIQALLRAPAYAGLFNKTNQFANPPKPGEMEKPVTAQSTADWASNYLWSKNPLADPVEIVELRGRTELYRFHDGNAQLYKTDTKGKFIRSAGTLGRFMDRALGARKNLERHGEV